MMARPARCGASEAEGLRRIREAERRRLSRALHDQAGPSLCSAGLLAELLYGAIPDPAPQQQELFARLRSALESAVDQIRLLSQEASPDLAARRGLEGALAVLAQAHHAQLFIEELPALPAGAACALCELTRDALLACGGAPGAARIHASRRGIRIEPGGDPGEDAVCVLEQAACAAGFGFAFNPAPAAAFEFLVRENS
ncbi:MAG: histidine kinase [Bryobacteraceae bacterium]